jgi:hypothetical protein
MRGFGKWSMMGRGKWGKYGSIMFDMGKIWDFQTNKASSSFSSAEMCAGWTPVY